MVAHKTEVEKTDASRLRYQLAYTLRHGGMTYEALGRKLGVTREYARSLVHRAEQLLKKERRLINMDFTEIVNG